MSLRFFSRGGVSAVLLIMSGLLLNAPQARAQISLYSAVDLARRNSASVRIAQADVLHAEAGVSEAQDVYIPSLTAGSAAGYSYGFLGGVPSVFDAQIQSLVISFSQPDYIRAARSALHSAQLALQDALDQVELDSALDYIQLDTITRELSALDEEKLYGQRLDAIEADRLSAGVESEIAATRAQLTAAQSDLKRIDLIAQAAVLRKRLSNLTGLPEDSLLPEGKSIPAAPANEESMPVKQTAGVEAGFSNAVSKHYMAHGDDRQNYRPQIGFGFTYDYLDTNLNNYNNYYNNKLRPNNFGIAAQITLPLFDRVKTARARESAAEALHADTQAEQGRQQADEQVVQLQKSLPTLRAQARIAELQAKLASQQLDAVLVQVNNAPSSPSATPVTPADEMQARIDERARFSDALEARFQLMKAEIALLRATGALGNWINSAARQ